MSQKKTKIYDRWADYEKVSFFEALENHGKDYQLI